MSPLYKILYDGNKILNENSYIYLPEEKDYELALHQLNQFA
jgi:hypothetical protein